METETFCIPNIGKKQRQMRLWFGVIFLVIGLALAIPLVANDAPAVARLGLFIPFFLSMIGIFQAQGKTWVRLAAQGLRDMDSGPEQITDKDILIQVRKQAQQVYIKSIASSVIFTAIFLVIWCPLWV